MYSIVWIFVAIYSCFIKNLVLVLCFNNLFLRNKWIVYCTSEKLTATLHEMESCWLDRKLLNYVVAWSNTCWLICLLIAAQKHQSSYSMWYHTSCLFVCAWCLCVTVYSFDDFFCLHSMNPKQVNIFCYRTCHKKLS